MLSATFHSLAFPHFELMSFVSGTNVASFLFHMIIYSDVALELPMKQSGALGGGWFCG